MSPAEGAPASLPVENVRQPALESTTVKFDRQWQRSLLRPWLLTLMLGCVVTAATYVFVALLPAFTESMANMMIACSALAALTGCLVDAMAWEAGRDVTERLKFRIIEPVGWMLLLRLGLWWVAGGLPPAALLLSEPLTAAFDGAFIAGSLIVLAVWGTATFLNRALLALSLQPEEVSHIARAYGRLSDPVENTLRSDRRAQLDRFVALWIGLGIVVIVLAAGSQVRPAANEGGFLTIHAQNIHPRAIVSTIAYFFAGFLLIGQAHLAALRARWALDGLAVDERRFRSWMLYVVGCVALVALVTSLVPVGDTILLLRVITAVWRVMQAFLFLLLSAFGWLVNLFVSDDSGATEEPALPPFEMPETFQPDEEVAAPGNDFSYVPTLVFWAFVALAALIGSYHLLAARGFDWNWIKARLARLLGLFRRALDVGRRIVADVAHRVAGADVMSRPRAERRARRNMNLDEQVQFAYLSILDAAAEQGVGRRAAETPRRYAPRLAAALAATDASRAQTAAEAAAEAEAATTEATAVDVKGVTETFYRARYSRQASEPRDLLRVRSLLEQVRNLWRRTGNDVKD